MNKYTLGTIVGVSLVSLIKSKLGSNLRLKLKEEEHIEASYLIDLKKNTEGPWEDDEIEYMEQHIIQYLSEHQINGIKVFVEDIQILNTNEWMPVDEDETEHYLSFKLIASVRSGLEIAEDQNDYLSDYYDNLVSYLKSVYRNEFNGRLICSDEDTFESETFIKQIIVNADTGEEYKPIEKRTKLRKR